MKYLIALSFLSAATLLSAQEQMIIYEKGPCMGKCPVFKISVTTDKILTFRAINNFDSLGHYDRLLSNKEFRKLRRLFKKSKIHNLYDAYDKDVMDASITKISFTHNGRQNQVSYKIGSPSEKLNKAAGYLLALSPMESSSSFTFTPAMENKKESDIQPSSNLIGRKEIQQPTLIVELDHVTELERWRSKYKNYDLKIVKQIIPNKKMYLITFDPTKIQAQKMLDILKKDTEVLAAQYNREINPR